MCSEKIREKKIVRRGAGAHEIHAAVEPGKALGRRWDFWKDGPCKDRQDSEEQEKFLRGQGGGRLAPRPNGRHGNDFACTGVSDKVFVRRRSETRR